MRKRSVVIFSFILQTCLLYSIEIPNILINKSLDNSILFSHRQLNIHNYRGKKLNEIQCSGKILIKDNEYYFLWYVAYNENISSDEIINMSAIREGVYFVDTPLFSDK